MPRAAAKLHATPRLGADVAGRALRRVAAKLLVHFAEGELFELGSQEVFVYIVRGGGEVMT